MVDTLGTFKEVSGQVLDCCRNTAEPTFSFCFVPFLGSFSTFLLMGDQNILSTLFCNCQTAAGGGGMVVPDTLPILSTLWSPLRLSPEKNGTELNV